MPETKNENEVNSDFTLDESEIPSIQSAVASIASVDESPKIDDAVKKNTIESDREYRQITKDIIEITNAQLSDHTEAKKPLRKNLLCFIKSLLLLQFFVLVGIFVGKGFFNFNISDYVINIYIVSVFVETLSGLLIMIRFSFDANQEIELIKILNSIVLNFKKYNEK